MKTNKYCFELGKQNIIFKKKKFSDILFTLSFSSYDFIELNFRVISGAIKSNLENCIFRTDRKQSFNFEEIHTKQAFQPSNIVVELNSSTPYSFLIIRPQNFKVIFLKIVFFRVMSLGSIMK